VLLFGRMSHTCAASTEREISAVIARVSIVFRLGTVHDARESKSEGRLMSYIHQQLKAFVIRLRIVVFLYC
jgi:hypothetical protein